MLLPKLGSPESYIKDALILIYLSQGYPNTRKVSKTELTRFIRFYYPEVNDVQQARHLGAQKGWYIAAGGRDNVVVQLQRGEYQLVSREKPYPAFHGHRVSERVGDVDSWVELKTKYHFKCVTCGSEEDKLHLHWPATRTKLQKGHMDPSKPLEYGNIIPQCQKCNRGDRNNWVYDERGRAIKVANPNVISRSSEDVQWKTYRILYKKFRGASPNEQE